MEEMTYCHVKYNSFRKFEISLNNLKEAFNCWEACFKEKNASDEMLRCVGLSLDHQYINCYYTLLKAVKEFVLNLNLHEFEETSIHELTTNQYFLFLYQNVSIKDDNEIKDWYKIQHDFESYFEKWISELIGCDNDQIEFFIEQATNIHEYIKTKIKYKK